MTRMPFRASRWLPEPAQCDVMMLGPYAYFIVMSYALAAAIVLNLIGWIAYDYRSQKARLRALEANGMARRSNGTTEPR